MGFGSPETMKQRATARPPEGWSTFRVNKIRVVKTKPYGVEIENIVFDLAHENGSELSWWIKEDNRIATANLAKLAEYAGLQWDDDTSAESIATLLSNSLDMIDAKIGWGKGDGAFVNDVALAGEGGSPEDLIEQPQQQRQPVPASMQTQTAAAQPARRKAAW